MECYGAIEIFRTNANFKISRVINGVRAASYKIFQKSMSSNSHRDILVVTYATPSKKVNFRF